LRSDVCSHSLNLVVLAYATTGSHRARAQSAVADGARARNRTRRVHGINATCVTAHKPPFPNSRIILLISISLSFTKFPPEHRVEQDGMRQSYDRSSTRTSTKNIQNKTMHRSGRSAALNLRNHFGGHSVMVAVRASHRISSYSYSAKRYSVKRYSYSMAV
jgi:hypothetical protein